MLLHHLANLEEDSLANQIYKVQEKLALLGIVPECQPYFVTFGIIDVRKYSKLPGKNLINQKIISLNRDKVQET